MSTIQKYEDLICWQRARELTKNIYKEFKSLKFEDRGLQDQIQRASVSIMSNIAEGFERGTKQEFLNYLFIAKGSAGEVRAQLYVALDAGYLNEETFKNLKFKAEECSKLISNFTKSLKVSQFTGLQYKHEYRKGMSDLNKMFLKRNPDWIKYYDKELDEILFWKIAEDKRKEEEKK